MVSQYMTPKYGELPGGSGAIPGGWQDGEGNQGVVEIAGATE